MKWSDEISKIAAKCKYCLLEDGKTVCIHRYDPKSKEDLGITGLGRNETDDVIFIDSYVKEGELYSRKRKVLCFSDNEYELKAKMKNMVFERKHK